MNHATNAFAPIAIALIACPLATQSLTTELVANGLDRPVYATTAPGDDSRIFVVEQSGKVRIVQSGVVSPTPFLDLGPTVAVGGETGLLGLAFDPEFATNGFVYIMYTQRFAIDTVVERYVVSASNPDAVDPASASIIVGPIGQPSGVHNGGCIQFGPDGYLYIGTGDGGAGPCAAQAAMSLLGKILRVDRDGNAPATNPHVQNPAIDDRVWAFGLRNPWRFSFDRGTGDLWIGDVGSSNREEINFQPANAASGGNYGWPIMEGDICRLTCGGAPTCNAPALTLPIRSVPTSQACAIVGGYVYRGCAMPWLRGTYFHAEFCGGTVWSFRYDGATLQNLVDRTAELGTPGLITSFGEDADGELLICSRDGGRVFRVVPRGNLTTQPAGNGSTGSNGTVPYHEVCGVLGTGNSATLYVRNATPTTLGAFVFSPASTPAPLPLPGFGTLIPSTSGFFTAPFVTDARGSASLTVTGGGTPVSLYHQAALVDVGLGGVTLSNAWLTLFD